MNGNDVSGSDVVNAQTLVQEREGSCQGIPIVSRGQPSNSKVVPSTILFCIVCQSDPSICLESDGLDSIDVLDR